MKRTATSILFLCLSLQVFGQVNDIERKDDELHIREQKAHEQKVFFHNKWMLGVWIPQGNLALLGEHPFFGYGLGMKYKKMTVDVSLGVKKMKIVE